MSTQEASPAPRPGGGGTSRRNGVVGAVLTVAVLVVVFAGILPRFGDYSAAWDAVRSMSVLQIVALSVAVAVSIAAYPLPFWAALHGVRYRTAFMVCQTGFTVANTVPAGGAIGLGVQYGMLSRAGFAGPASSAAVGINAVFNVLATLILPILGAVAFVLVGSPTASEVAGALVALGLVAAAVLGAGLALRSDRGARRVGQWVERLAGRATRLVGKEAPTGIATGLVRFHASTAEVVRRRWAALSLTSLLVQLTQFSVFLVAVRVTSVSGGSVPFAAVFAAFALARLGSFIPVTPGGLGTVDASLVGLLVAFGAARTDALAGTLLWRGASWMPQVLLGTVTFVSWRIANRPGAPRRAVRS